MVFYRVSNCSGDRGHSIASSLRSQTFRFISLPKDVTISLKPLLCKNATPYWQALVSVTRMNHIFPRRKKRYTLIKFCDKISFKVNCVFYYLYDFVVRDIKIAAYLQKCVSDSFGTPIKIKIVQAKRNLYLETFLVNFNFFKRTM